MLGVLLLGQCVAHADFPGGFVENQATNYRTRLTTGQIAAFMPATRLTKFTFPAPYNTTAWRITDSTDCGGADCVQAGYPYWYKINNHQNSNTMKILVDLPKSKGGGGPTLFLLDKTTEILTDAGPIWSAGNPLSDSVTAAQWYWSLTQEDLLYLVPNGSTSLKTYNVTTTALTTVVDLNTKIGTGVFMWQTHASADDVHHVGTVCQDSGAGFCESSTNDHYLSCWYYNSTTTTFRTYARVGGAGSMDECHLSKDGRYTVMTDVVAGHVQQRIFENLSGSLVQTLAYASNGAFSHVDTGYTYIVGAESFQSGAFPDRAASAHVFTFPNSPAGEIFYNEDFTTHYLNQMNHLSHGNAKAGMPLQQQMTCGSNAQDSSGTFEEELICVTLDNPFFQQLVVAPLMSDLSTGKGDGGQGNPSFFANPFLSIDVTGHYGIWTSNLRGSRLDAFLVKIPSQLIVPDLVLPPVSPPTASPMTLIRTSGTIIDENGMTVDSATVDVFAQVTGPRRDAHRLRLFQDAAGTKPLKNPFLSAADGSFTFYTTESTNLRVFSKEGRQGLTESTAMEFDVPVTIDVATEGANLLTVKKNTVVKFFIDTNGNVHLPVVATADLPAASSAMDNTVLIEDNGTGDRNLVIYAGGQRFRLDGGGAF